MFNDQIKLLEITRYELYLSTIKEHEKAKGLTIRANCLTHEALSKYYLS